MDELLQYVANVCGWEIWFEGAVGRESEIAVMGVGKELYVKDREELAVFLRNELLAHQWRRSQAKIKSLWKEKE